MFTNLFTALGFSYSSRPFLTLRSEDPFWQLDSGYGWCSMCSRFPPFVMRPGAVFILYCLYLDALASKRLLENSAFLSNQDADSLFT